MTQKSPCDIAFVRLPEIDNDEFLQHMTDPRVAEHMPLLVGAWDDEAVASFVAAKEACWHRDGLGHWAILCDGSYVGWGGFQKEGMVSTATFYDPDGNALMLAQDLTG